MFLVRFWRLKSLQMLDHHFVDNVVALRLLAIVQKTLAPDLVRSIDVDKHEGDSRILRQSAPVVPQKTRRARIVNHDVSAVPHDTRDATGGFIIGSYPFFHRDSLTAEQAAFFIDRVETHDLRVKIERELCRDGALTREGATTHQHKGNPGRHWTIHFSIVSATASSGRSFDSRPACGHPWKFEVALESVFAGVVKRGPLIVPLEGTRSGSEPDGAPRAPGACAGDP